MDLRAAIRNIPWDNATSMASCACASSHKNFCVLLNALRSFSVDVIRNVLQVRLRLLSPPRRGHRKVHFDVFGTSGGSCVGHCRHYPKVGVQCDSSSFPSRTHSSLDGTIHYNEQQPEVHMCTIVAGHGQRLLCIYLFGMPGWLSIPPTDLLFLFQL